MTDKVEPDLPDWLREAGDALDQVVGLTPGAPRPLYAEPGEPTAAEMNRNHLNRAADLVAAYGTTLEEATEVIRRAMIDPSPPFAAYGIAVDFRWWERPRRLWARHATKRTATALGF